MLYRLVYILAFIVLKVAFFIRIEGRENYRNIQGGFVAICNHVSNWDPIVLGFSIKGRPVHYLAKEELFRSRIARFFLTRLYAVPISRGKSDTGAIRKALEILKDGNVLGIFPEGTRSGDGVLGPFEPGAALLSLKSGAPVVPVYISGGYRLFRQVTVRIGMPVDLGELYRGSRATSAVTRQAAQVLRDRMLQLATQ